MSVPPLRVPRRLQYRVFPGPVAAIRGGFGHSGVIDVSVLDEGGSEAQEQGNSSRRRLRGKVGAYEIVYIFMAFAAGLITGIALTITIF